MPTFGAVVKDADAGHYTIVRNTSGSQQKFSFLGRHGVTLDNNAYYAHLGNLANHLMPTRTSSKRSFTAFRACLDDGRLALVQFPSVILYDKVLKQSRMLQLNNGTLSAVAPFWLNLVNSF